LSTHGNHPSHAQRIYTLYSVRFFSENQDIETNPASSTAAHKDFLSGGPLHQDNPLPLLRPARMPQKAGRNLHDVSLELHLRTLPLVYPGRHPKKISLAMIDHV